MQSNEKHAVAAGKKPFYLKKSEQKKLELLARYRGGGWEGRGGGRSEQRKLELLARYYPDWKGREGGRRGCCGWPNEQGIDSLSST